LQKLPMAMELRISLFPPFLKCLRVRPCECGCIHEDTLFTLSRLVSFNSSADGWSNWRRCLAVFPRHKGRTKLISILPFWQLLVGPGVEYKSLLSHGVRLFLSYRRLTANISLSVFV
jgi:hypothetical protein